MKIIYDNWIDDATLTASSTAEGYDVNNLKVPQLLNNFIFDGNNESVTMDFTTAVELKTFIIDIGNMSSTATITLEGNATDVWTSPSYSQAMTKTETAAYLLLDEEYRWWRLTLDDSTVVDIEVGYIHAGGAALQMPSIDPQVELFYSNTSSATISISGQVYGNTGYNFLETSFNFSQITEGSATTLGVPVATRQEFVDFFNTVNNTQPFWVFLWSNNLDEFPPQFCISANKSLQLSKLGWGKNYSTTLALRGVR